MASALDKLTNRQRTFVMTLAKGTNGGAAAVAAGVNPKTASTAANKWLKKPQVIAALAEIRNETKDEVIVTVKRVLEELVVIGFSDIRHYEQDKADPRKLALAPGAPEAAMRAVSSVKFKTYIDRDGDERSTELEFKLWPKNDALQLIARHLGMLVDNLKVDAGDSLATMVLEAAKLRAGKK